MKFLRASLPAQIKIEMNLAPDAPAVLADPTQIYQVTMNLATNALHAMEGQPGQLTVKSGIVSARRELHRSASGIQTHSLCAADRRRHRPRHGRQNFGAHL